MGLTTADIVYFQSYTFIIAAVIAIAGIAHFVIRPLYKRLRSGKKLSREQRLAFCGFNIGIFFVIAGVAVALGCLWYMDLTEKEMHYEDIVRALRTNEEPEQWIDKLKLLLERIEPRLSPKESQTLKAIHGRANLKQFTDDLKNIDEASLNVLENTTFSRMVAKHGYFFPPNSDRAREVCETRNILGYAEAISVASIGVFLPLLIMLWNNAKETISDRLYWLISLRDSNAQIDQEVLKDSISSTHDDLKELKKIGKDMGLLFWPTIVVIVIFLTSLAYVNFMVCGPPSSYILAVIHKAASVVLFLWFLTFLSIYEISVQPMVRKLKDPRLFGLKEI